MANKKLSKVLSMSDLFVVSFGAMIGWGWVVSSGDWITTGGVLGAIIGFILGGIMIFFIGLCYAELTAAIPECGGEHVFSMKAFGKKGSFVCTWAIILGYVTVVCFEAVSFPTIIQYIFPGFLKGYLYTIAGFDIYLTWLLLAIFTAVVITIINIIGAKTAAIFQKIFVYLIAGSGILLLVTSLFNGDASNLNDQLFLSDSLSMDSFKGIIGVALLTPFYYIGFDVIPQAVEEINIPIKKVGKMIVISISIAVIFYSLIILSIGLLMNSSEIASSMNGSGLVTADAMAKAFNSDILAKVIIIGGLAGIISSWNSFVIGGSRAIYSMANSDMLPVKLGMLHKKYNTPVWSILLIGILSILAVFFGRKALIWFVNAGNFACCIAYCMVCVGYLIIRKNHPNLERPYKIKYYKTVGLIAIIMSLLMILLYILPIFETSLQWQEWIIVCGWSLLGLLLLLFKKKNRGVNNG